MEHTKEPWTGPGKAPRYAENSPVTVVVSAGGYSLAHMYGDNKRENAKRIVQCVNACAGIEDPETAIKALRDACELALSALQDIDATQELPDLDVEFGALEKALALVENQE